MSNTYSITPGTIDLKAIASIISGNLLIGLSADAKQKVAACRKYLEAKIAADDKPFYGINTGFGSLCNVKISKSELEELQHNLVVSHACGTGDEIPAEIVKLMLLFKIKSLAYGHSAIQLETIERLIFFFNNNILPVVYQQGSLGASGDLAPLAHLALPLLGLGEVNYKGKKNPTSEVLKSHNLQPITLKAKEGLALINGTQMMSAYSYECIRKARHISLLADTVSALSLDGFFCLSEPFAKLLQEVRPHYGQAETAGNIRKLLDGSEILKQKKEQVQDPYSFRCIPQVHGACKQAIDYVSDVIQTEINSVTDNPNVFPDEDKILIGGNFHGEILAQSLDFLAIALAELGNISERRTYQLLTGQRGLPAYLTSNPGLNSGLMIPQYTAASIVSQNKQLCTPASVDSIVSSNGQEDHVSMGANAATKAYRICLNLETILAIELLTASQALEMRRPLRSSAALEKWCKSYRTVVPFITNDRPLYEDIKASVRFIRESKLPL